MPMPQVVSVNVSTGGIPKLPVACADVLPSGLQGDGHHHAKHNTPLQAISLMDVEDLEDLKREGFPVGPGAMGENVTIAYAQVDDLKPGDRLIFSGGVEIEVTRLRKPCYVLDSIDPRLKSAVVGRCGALAKVVRTGALRAGETAEVKPAAPPWESGLRSG